MAHVRNIIVTSAPSSMTEKTLDPTTCVEAGVDGAKGDIAQLQEHFGYVERVAPTYRSYAQELPRNRSLLNMTLMMMTMAAIPYGMGSTFCEPHRPTLC